MAGSVTLQGQLTGIPAGQLQIGPFTLSANSANNLQIQSLTLSSGANTITVPTWAVGCVILPSTSNAVGLTLKGVSGDTGIALGLTDPQFLNFPVTPPASFVLTAASNFITITEIVFF